MKTIIEISHLCKSYGKKNVIKNLDLNIQEGEFVSIVGRSGCGKSTLLNIVGALESYDNGAVYFKGKKLARPDSRQAIMLRRKYINYLFQSYALVPQLSVVDNINLALIYSGLSNNKKKMLIDGVLRKVYMDEYANEKVINLSGGEQQRVALARAIVKPGNVILADEPTGALDERTAEKVFGLLQNMSKDFNKTVLMVTHNTDLARRTDRVIQL